MTEWLANSMEWLLDFSNVLNSSISASWMVLAVIVLRFILKKAPRWIHVTLWGLVAVRLLLPFSIESAFSLIPSAETIPQEIMQVEGNQLQQPAHFDVVSNPIFFGGTSVEVGQTIDRVQVQMVNLSFIWLIGIIILLVYTVISYWRLRRKVDTAVIYKDNSFQSENVASPFVLGIIKPRIYLPFDMNEQDLEHVIAHEQAHISRKDHWWKPLGFLLLTIHWFNPLMWIAYVLLCRDIELACDEKVIKELGNEQRANYTQALVACSVNRRMIAACPLAFGEVGVKDRVKSVMNYKKPAFWIIIVAVISCVVVAVCFLTNPAITVDERLAVFIDCEIASQHQTEHSKDNFCCLDWEVIGKEQSGNLTTVYMWVLYKEYSNDDVLTVETASHLLTVITAKKENGNYSLVEYWIPEDGSYYTDSIKEKVPMYLWGKAFDSQRYIDRQSADLERMAKEHFAKEATSQNTGEGEAIGKTYLYEKDGFMGDFKITLYDDGTFSYYEGLASSYLGFGTWSQDGNTITLSDDDKAGYPFVNHFSMDGDSLVFIEEGSSNFIYVKVANGERFNLTGNAYKPNSNNEISSNQNETWDLIPMVMVDGILYLDTGHESTVDARCGVMDGEITSSVDNGKPTKDNQSNFGTGYGYQYGPTEGTIEIFMNEKWWVFATEEVRQEIQFPSEQATTEGDAIDVAINKAILEHYASDKPDGLIHVESHVLLANECKSGTPLIGEDNHIEETTFYLLVLHEKYSTYGSTLESVGGSYVPTAITFSTNEFGEYIMREYWEPRDGSYYAKDIRNKFPGASADDALNDQAYIEDLQAQNLNKAQAYMNSTGSMDFRIAELLDIIQSSPATSSNPSDYIDAHEKEYQELLSYGQYTLRYCFSKFLSGGQTDLLGHIMANACEEINISWGEALLIDGPAPVTGQDWFNAFKGNALRLSEQYSDEDMEKYYPASSLLLHMINE